MFKPECASKEDLTSPVDADGMTDESTGAENGTFCAGILLLPPTGNKGCDTGTGGAEAGSPGGVICTGWRAGGVDDAIGGFTFCTGNNGC